MKHHRALGLLLGGLTLLGSSSPTFATDLYVPSDYPTIQAAIDAAVDGDEVIISPGTYFYNINFLGKQITVRSKDRDPTTVTIDADGLMVHVVHFSGISTTDARLIGITVTGSGLNFQGSTGGGIWVEDGKAKIDRCIIRGNTANTGAGISAAGSVEISQCLIYDNVSNAGGAGMYLQDSANAGGSPKVINCVVAANQSLIGQSAGIFVFEADTEIRNTIIGFNNGSSQLQTSFGTIDAQYSLVEGGFSGTGNIDELPMFVDYDARDFRLATNSPCIDAGDSNALDPGIVDDIATNPRRMHDPNTANTGVGVPTIDMGAYEYIPRVRYVDQDATGAGTGLTWTDAYTDFIPAINAVTADVDADEIWVAQGSYFPDELTGDRNRSFNMRTNQTWRGGFEGGELFADQAEPLNNMVTLNGRVNGFSGDDTYHIVRALSVSNSVIDGFTLYSGNATDGIGGGGMLITEGADILASQVWIWKNNSSDGGAAVLVQESAATFEACIMTENISTAHTGGIEAVEAEVTCYSTLIGWNQGALTGGIHATESELNVLNGIVYCNYGDPDVATHGVQSDNSNTSIINTILWNNQGNELDWIGAQPLVSHSTIEDASQGYLDPSNNGTDPQFLQYPGLENFFKLRPQSNCIDSGDNSAVSPSGLDFLGNTRQLDDIGMPDTGSGTSPIVDRGLIEFTGTSCAYDCDDSGDVGINDLLFILGAWGDTNGDPICEYMGEPGGDGFVDVLELLGLLGAWGNCP